MFPKRRFLCFANVDVVKYKPITSVIGIISF